MTTHPAPSAYILRKAWQLGQKMAQKERRLLPDLTGAAQFPTYSLFRQSHRYHLEQRPGFQSWDTKLQALIEREGNGRRLAIDNPRVWDAFYTHIGAPIRNAFWLAWEDAYQLEASYLQAITKAEQIRSAAPAALHVYRPDADRPLVDISDPDVWAEIAEQLVRDADRNRDRESPSSGGAA